MRKLLLAIAIIAISQTGTAQMKFAVGPKIGLGFNTLNEKINGESVQDFYNTVFATSDVKATAFNIGFVWGGFVELRFTDWLAIGAEYSPSNEGTGVKFTENGQSYNDGNNDFTRRYKMTNIPLMLKVGVGNGVDVYGGVQLATLREVTEFTGTRSPDNKPQTIPEDEYEETFGGDIETNWTAIIGGISLEQQGVVIDLRVTIGPEIGKNPDNYSAKPMSAQLTFGYKLMGKRD